MQGFSFKQYSLAGKVIVSIALLMFVLIVFYPLITLLFESLQIIFSGKSNLSLLLPYGRRLKLLSESVLFSFSVTIVVIILSILSSSFLMQFNKGWLSKMVSLN